MSPAVERPRTEPQPTWLLALPWLLVIAAGALWLFGPAPDEPHGWTSMQVRDAAWLSSGALLVVSGLRGVRSPGAPRMSWGVILAGVALLVGSALMAQKLGERFEALSRERTTRPSAGYREALAASAADAQAPMELRVERSLQLARAAYEDSGEVLDRLTLTGERVPFEPTPQDVEARRLLALMEAMLPRLEQVRVLIGVLLGVSLLIGSVMSPRPCLPDGAAVLERRRHGAEAAPRR